uniref:Uncharacterized protein n=1 Tax=Avena sativa TaxID=4498 RepID=A0ACD5VUC2_AVESA
MEVKPASTAEEQSKKTISMADLEKGLAVEEVRIIIRNYLVAAIIKHTFNLFYVVTLAGYIFLFWGALKFYPPFYAVLEILVMTPCFWMMLKSLPILKRFYIKKYAAGSLQAFMWFALRIAALVVIWVVWVLLAFRPLKLQCKPGFLPCIKIWS